MLHKEMEEEKKEYGGIWCRHNNRLKPKTLSMLNIVNNATISFWLELIEGI